VEFMNSNSTPVHRDGLAVLDDVFPVGKGSPLLLDPPSLVTIMFGSNDLLTPGVWTREDGKDGHGGYLTSWGGCA
jgi:lysophospholipase L1-like esterase